MPQSYISLFYHLVFGTHDSLPLLSADIRRDLHPYIGGIINKELGKVIKVNGVNDHIHILYAANARVAIADASRLIKSNSSKWLNEKYPWKKRFAWQDGYGAFSVGLRAVPVVKQYIERQEEHHRIKSWNEEWAELQASHAAFLRKLQME